MKPNVLQSVTPALDPRIVAVVNLLERALRTQKEVKVGVVVAAVGVLLGAKVTTYEHLEPMVAHLTAAVRVGFYLAHGGKQ